MKNSWWRFCKILWPSQNIWTLIKNMVSAWRNFKFFFYRHFWPKILKCHPHSILTKETMVVFVIYCFNAKKILLNHRELLFECALCTFANMYRRDLVWHLREHHRKEHGFSDGQLVKEFVHMPKDLRKIICIKCSETEAHENAVWLAVDPNEVCGEIFYLKSWLFNKVHLWCIHVH